MARGPVFVVTGQSGAGKGTLIRRLLERLPTIELAVSATTRPRRPDEEDGRDYWFLTDEEFDARLREQAFLEWVTFPWGQRSGTLRSELERILDRGHACLLELEINGALVVKEDVPGSVTIFITAPIAELERRLRERGTETPGEIEERLELARRQLERIDEFDRVIENDDLARASDELTAIVEQELVAAGTMLRP